MARSLRTDRRAASRCAFVALAALAALPACVSSSDAGPAGDLDAGMTGDGGATGDGGLFCSMTPTGCLCFAGDPDPSQLAACAASSVTRNAGEEGTCCSSEQSCQCDAYVCKSDPATSYCACGLAYDVAMLPVQGGAAVTSCPTPTGNQRCCLLLDGSTCVCSRLACDLDVSTEVASCALATVTACGAGLQATAACK